MQEGKVSQAVFERSVQRPLIKTGACVRGEAGLYGSTGEEGGYVRGSAFSPIDGFGTPRAEMILDEALNKLGPALLSGVSVNMMIPPCMEEGQLRELILRLGQEAAGAGVMIKECFVSVSCHVSAVLLNVEAWGRAVFSTGSCEPGQDLIMAGNCGAAGTGILAACAAGQLSGRFPGSFLREAETVGRDLLIGKAVRSALDGEASIKAWKAVAEGGVFRALWEMCEEGKCGLEADLHRIPIRQETVELCEFLNRNPYRLYGCGAALIAAENGEAVRQKLLLYDLPCEIVGRLTKGPGRYIRNREITRCLEKPLPDALLQEG